MSGRERRGGVEGRRRRERKGEDEGEYRGEREDRMREGPPAEGAAGKSDFSLKSSGLIGLFIASQDTTYNPVIGINTR